MKQKCERCESEQRVYLHGRVENGEKEWGYLCHNHHKVEHPDYNVLISTKKPEINLGGVNL